LAPDLSPDETNFFTVPWLCGNIPVPRGAIVSYNAGAVKNITFSTGVAYIVSSRPPQDQKIVGSNPAGVLEFLGIYTLQRFAIFVVDVETARWRQKKIHCNAVVHNLKRMLLRVFDTF
jgi:hypothetical protein